jgi:hypothetical protein
VFERGGARITSYVIPETIVVHRSGRLKSLSFLFLIFEPINGQYINERLRGNSGRDAPGRGLGTKMGSRTNWSIRKSFNERIAERK